MVRNAVEPRRNVPAMRLHEFAVDASLYLEGHMLLEHPVGYNRPSIDPGSQPDEDGGDGNARDGIKKCGTDIVSRPSAKRGSSAQASSTSRDVPSAAVGQLPDEAQQRPTPLPPPTSGMYPDAAAVVDVEQRAAVSTPQQSAIRPRILSAIERTQQYDRYRMHIPVRIDEPYKPTALEHSGIDYQPVRASCLGTILDCTDFHWRRHAWYGFVATVFYMRTSAYKVDFVARDRWGTNVRVVIYKDACRGKRDEPTNLALHYANDVQLQRHERYLILFHREWLTRIADVDATGAYVEINLKRGSMVSVICR
jgi:hypothetical protein